MMHFFFFLSLVIHTLRKLHVGNDGNYLINVDHITLPIDLQHFNMIKDQIGFSPFG